MTNAEKFRETFRGLFATELWTKSENEFLEWLNAPYMENETPDETKQDVYYVSMAIDGRYTAEIHVDDISELEKAITEAYEEADFGELECIEMKVDHIEDIYGNFIDI